MKSHSINRRRFLRGAGGIALALPWLEVMRPTPAHSQPAPGTPKKRFVVMYSPNGTIAQNWRPNGSERAFTLSPILSPLSDHQNDLIVVQGLRLMADAKGDGHQDGIAGLLTGDRLNPGEFRGGAGSSGWASNISLDQRIAQLIGKDTRFASLEFGVQVRDATVWHRISYLGSDQPVPPESDPLRAYARIFGGAAASDPALVTRQLQLRKSMLDVVLDDFHEFNANLGAADKAKLDSHFAALRDIEQRLSIPAASSCSPPELGAPLNLFLNDNYPAIGRLQMDLLATSLACDLTGVASLLWSRAASRTRFTWLNIQEEHHTLSHAGDGDTAAMDALTRINAWYAGEFAYLISKLKSFSEGEGSVFDGCALLWGNELGKGNSHSHDDAPFVLAGSGGGHFQTGRYLAYQGEPHNNLLLSLIHAMGGQDASFGAADWCTGTLAGLS
jgi:hypothetical protein